MTSALESYVDKTIAVVTGDGRIIVGLMKGFDQTINLVLYDAHERVYSSAAGVELVPLGLYIIRGDNVGMIGEIDVELDRRLDFANIKAAPLGVIWTQ